MRLRSALEVNQTELHSDFKVSLGYTATSCLQRKCQTRGQNVAAALLMTATNRMNQVFIINEILENNSPRKTIDSGKELSVDMNEFQSAG